MPVGPVDPDSTGPRRPVGPVGRLLNDVGKATPLILGTFSLCMPKLFVTVRLIHSTFLKVAFDIVFYLISYIYYIFSFFIKIKLGISK
jgi:hypothetical protein